jgi:hypothetical protein
VCAISVQWIEAVLCVCYAAKYARNRASSQVKSSQAKSDAASSQHGRENRAHARLDILLQHSDCMICSYNYTQLSLPGCNPIVARFVAQRFAKRHRRRALSVVALWIHIFVVGQGFLACTRTQQHAQTAIVQLSSRCEAWVPTLGVISIVHVCRHTAADTEGTSSRLVKGGWWPALNTALCLDVIRRTVYIHRTQD